MKTVRVVGYSEDGSQQQVEEPPMERLTRVVLDCLIHLLVVQHNELLLLKRTNIVVLRTTGTFCYIPTSNVTMWFETERPP
jgi:hypothetical protein